MTKLADITADYARQLLDYDPETGVLTWKARTPDMFKDGKRPKEWHCHRWNAVYAGRAAGGISDKGYIRLRLGASRIGSHRVIWLIVNGEWPADQIDHRNGNRALNLIDNLREATNLEQSQNRKKRYNNKSGVTGVYWDKSHSKWRAELQVNYRRILLGSFNDKDDAVAAYLEAKRSNHLFQPIPRES